MRIKLASVFVDDQEKALKFYTQVLGFVKKTELPAGDFKWLTVVSEGREDLELLLEPNANPPASEYQKAIYAAGIPATSFFVDAELECSLLSNAMPTECIWQEDVAESDLDAIRQAGLRLGISTHGIYEMLCAHACKPSYIALGAIYATATKLMPTAPQDLRRLEHHVRLMSPHYPLVAIGGIDLSRIEGVWARVDCAAVLRAIVDAADLRRATMDLLARTPRLIYGSGAA
jgi:thiamine-phosphate diphosphorylase